MATLIGKLFPFRLVESATFAALDVLLTLPVSGLSLRVRLLRSLPERFKVDIKVKEGTHQSENAGQPLSVATLICRSRPDRHSVAPAVNKQLNDKERVAGEQSRVLCLAKWTPSLIT